MPKQMSLEFLPLGSFGAEVRGWEFDYLPDASTIKLIRLALLKYKALVFRDRVLSAEELLAFTRLFGVELFRGDRMYWLSLEHPDVFRLSNQPEEGTDTIGEEWHCDGHYLPDPSAITAMHMVEASPNDGNLLIGDLEAAYGRLSRKQQERLCLLLAVNEGSGVIQPLVKRHPVTGAMGLYVNLWARTADASGRRYPEIDELLSKLLDDEGTYYRHACRPGDLLLVDNFAVCHRMEASDPANPQVMHRAQTTGRGVWWNWSEEEPAELAVQMLDLDQNPARLLQTLSTRLEKQPSKHQRAHQCSGHH